MFINSKTFGLLALLGGVALFSTVEVAAKITGNNAEPFQMVFRFFMLFSQAPRLPMAFIITACGTARPSRLR